MALVGEGILPLHITWEKKRTPREKLMEKKAVVLEIKKTRKGENTPRRIEPRRMPTEKNIHTTKKIL